jgi:hypothetical protein
LGVAAILVTGCASGDASLSSMKLGQAQRAVSDASQATAPVNAPVEIRQAETKLAAAREAAQRKDYGEAIRLADEAQADADYARAKSQNVRATKMADEMNQNIQTLRRELERLPQ